MLHVQRLFIKLSLRESRILFNVHKGNKDSTWFTLILGHFANANITFANPQKEKRKKQSKCVVGGKVDGSEEVRQAGSEPNRAAM